MQENLSLREKEVFDLLLTGKSPKEIAYFLGITYDTVNFHRKNLYAKLDVHNLKEFFAKYKTGAVVFPPGLPSAQNKEDGFLGVFDHWYAINDDKSTCMVSRKNEEIGEKIETCVTIRGTLYNDENYPRSANGYLGLDMPFAGAYGRPDSESLNAIRTMKSFSLKFLADGARYNVRWPTFETIEGDHWIYVFPTVKDEVSSITVNIPGDLIRLGWSEKEVEFILENIMFIQIQPVDPGDFNLKFWDVRLYN